MLGAQQRGLVAADVGLRAEGVHRLGSAERPRNRVEADRGHALLGQRLRRLRIDERAQEADDRLAGAHDLDLRFARLLDAQDDVRLAVQLHARDDRCPRLRVCLIGDQGSGSGTAFDEDLQPGRRQPAERFGYQGNSPLTGRSLLGDADLHGHHLT